MLYKKEGCVQGGELGLGYTIDRLSNKAGASEITFTQTSVLLAHKFSFYFINH